MWRGLTALAAALVVALPATAAAKAKPIPKVPGGWMGTVAGLELTQLRPGLVPSEFAVMRRSRVQAVRAQFSWSTIEPGPGTYDWTSPDQIVTAASRERLALQPTVILAPGWAALNPFASTPRPADPATYAAFLTTLIHRYGPKGSFWAAHPDLPRRPIHNWQVWNEFNGAYFWHQDPCVKDRYGFTHCDFARSFTALLKASHKAIHAADKRGKLVLGGVTNDSWNDLRKLYRAGARPYFDIAAVHPYTNAHNTTETVGNVLEELKRFRGVMARFGDGRKPVVLTELGWPSGKGHTDGSPNDFLNVTVHQQASLLTMVYTRLARLRVRDHIAAVYWFSWLSFDTSKTNAFGYSGLRTLKYGAPRDKPSLIAYRKIARKLERHR
jgi:hypothetical protein